MLHQYIRTRPASLGRSDAWLFSIAAHCVIIIAAMSRTPATTLSRGEVVREKPTIERIRFFEMAAPVERPVASAPKPATKLATTGRRPARPLVAPLRVPTIGPIPLAVPVPIPDAVDIATKVSDSLDFKPVQLGDAVKGFVARRPDGVPAGGPYAADQVDKIVRPFSDNPKPVYPRRLISSGVEASFIVHFVVDSTGRVDAESMQFPPTAHELFIDSVRRALKRSRYRPAELGGRAVNQAVEQQFTFVITR
jgi:protein TonB